MSATNAYAEAAAQVLSDFYKNDILVQAKADGWCAALWSAIEETGMHLLLVPEASGGIGANMQEAAAIFRLCGRYCSPVPLAETLLASAALVAAGLPVPAGALTLAVAGESVRLQELKNGDWQIDGEFERVPYARFAQHAVIAGGTAPHGWIAVLPLSACHVDAGANLAGEARDRVTASTVICGAGAIATGGIDADWILRRGALARAIMACGALEQALEISVAYVKQRVQFDRPLIKFQAIQQEIAKLAGDAAFAYASAMSAVTALDTDTEEYAVAAAKVRTGMAAKSGSLIAHQLHGAIGVTEEYHLHHSTLRLWAWRSDYGTEAAWAQRLGRRLLDDNHGLWAQLTRV